MDERQQLPYTLTDAGRVPKIKDYGIEGGWAVAFPIMICGALSAFITGMWLLSGFQMWPLKVIVGLSPFWGSLAYVHGFVIGKPPAYRRDVLHTWRRYRLDWGQPVWRWLPILPTLSARHVCFTRPQDAALHPLIAAARKLRENA